MPKLTPATTARRKVAITAAALRCFQAKGFQGTTMADIIRESGMSAGSIYSHFASKYDLVASASAETYLEMEGRFAALGEIGDEPSPAALLNQIALVLEQSLPARMAMHVWVESQNDEALRTQTLTNLGRLLTSMTDALSPWAAEHGRNPSDLATTLLAAFQGYIARSSLDSSLTRDRFIESIRAAVG